MINRKYKCIFIHIHKTAGGAIWPAFDNYNPKSDKDNLKSGGIHHTAEMTKEFYGADVWNEYFKFTIVRSPWGKKVGSYEHTRKGGYPGVDKGWSHQNYFKWLKEFKMPKPPCGDYHDMNQFDWLTIDGKMSMDYIIRFEHFKEDWQEVVDILKITEPNKLAWGGKNDNQIKNGYYQFPEAYAYKQIGVPLDYSKYYTKESKNYVKERWKKDIEYFGFEFMNGNYNINKVGLLNLNYNKNSKFYAK
ncbi:MAG: hypothetical protein CBB96_03705 [Gammaproteobacteria bacterium TMED36]|mgnify:CR=1 FL=1|nr:MAG: hypothetical protein CBB96_03705 [Gammaproteobacteria bacterium TMED36]|tara:strand:+ start:6391 stop:7128 length:738 start_codon:yes stop_codon:yes gene_type:complete